MSDLLYAFCNMINTSSDLEGDILEFGTGSARHSKFICEVTSQSGKKFITFDGFQGLPETKKGVPYQTGWEPGNLKFSYEEALSILSVFENAEVVKTMSWDLKNPSDYNIEKVAAVNFDFDLYEGTIDALRFVQKTVWKKILFRFDDWGAYSYQIAEEVDRHEKAAFYDWIKETGYSYEEYQDLTRQSSGLQTIILVQR